MDEIIQQRLLQAQHDLLVAVPAGIAPLDDFRDQWTSLRSDIVAATAESRLCDETLQLAHHVSSAISLLADSFLTLEENYESISSTQRTDLEAIFERVSLTDSAQSANDHIIPSTSSVSASHLLSPASPIASNESAPLPDASSPCPPYIGAAYKWLVKNLHNPYPSTELKEKIASSSGSSLKTINAWFTSVRRRIGWTRILRKRFTNCRHDMLTAAYCCLVEDVPNQPYNRLIEYEFLEMKLKAEALYAPLFKKSQLAGTLDTVLKDLSPEDRERQEEAKEEAVVAARQRRDQEKMERRKERAQERAADRIRAVSSLPSPASSSRETTLELSESETEEAAPTAVAGRKRRSSSSHSCATDMSNKRPRTSRASSWVDDGRTSLPSPRSPIASPSLPFPPSPTAISAPTALASHKRRLSDVYASDIPEQGAQTSAHAHSSASPSTTQHGTPAAPASRKRRLSDASSQGAPKRPRGMAGIPRMQAVSDPFPSVKAPEVDSWYHQHFNLFDFGMPSAVTEGGLDLSTATDLEVLWSTPEPESHTYPAEQLLMHDYYNFAEAAAPPPSDDSAVDALPALPPLAFDLSDLPPQEYRHDPVEHYDFSSFMTQSASSPSTPPTDESNPYASLGSDTYSSGYDCSSLSFVPEPRFASENPFSGAGSEGITLSSIADMFSVPSPADPSALKRAKLEELRRHQEAARQLQAELEL
ncbi:hypothetical protein PLICRDRAFT_88366 [Plicaturopsis crispa FD-325 SS-3]|nr:hypothetical protein PLICRDRAFT_88366 [Plicaturopsis crispa FD-325 SS-3]